MKFFGRKLSIGKLEIDAHAVHSRSDSILKRLVRIEENYDRLDSILAELESKMERESVAETEKSPNPRKPR